MSSSISTLLTRNLHDVFGENDPARRRAAIDEIFTEDCVFFDPNGGVHRGRNEIDRIAGVIRATHSDFRYQPLAEPEELGNAGRVKWVEGRPGDAPAYAGTDFIIARDGRIAAVYFFFDKLHLNTALVINVTETAPANNDVWHIRISRDANSSVVLDDMPGDARLLGVVIETQEASRKAL